MTKKTRLIILLVCVACFFVAAPVLVAYSMGYRYDFEKMKIVATGGIYVRTFPTADQITIDSNISEKPGFLANSIFVQSLLPKSHTVSIKKSGYYDYFKTLMVREGLATKLQSVSLFKKNIAFRDVADKIDYFSVAPNNQNIITATVGTKATTFNYFSPNSTNQPKTLSMAQIGTVLDIKWSGDSSVALIKIQNYGSDFYYFLNITLQKPVATRLTYLDKNSQQISFNPQDSQAILYKKNKTLYSAKGDSSLPIINNLVAFKMTGNEITWLSSKGALSESSISGKLINQISSENFAVDTTKTYEIISISGDTFLKEDGLLFKLNQTTKVFEKFEIPVADSKILTSPDGKNLIYQNSEKIFLYSFVDKKFTELFSGSQINDCQWLNNDYIIFNSGDKIIISEIDYRGNINTVTLPQTITLTNPLTSSGQAKINIQNPKIYLDQPGQKLYILANNTLILSEKITQ